MNEAVLDASVVIKWFHAEGERNLEDALDLRRRYEAGELRVLAPPLLQLEILNVAARSWRWPEKRLQQLAGTLADLGFELVEPPLPALARWASRGLTAYDAAYVAVAEEAGVLLATDDAEIARAAPELLLTR